MLNKGSETYKCRHQNKISPAGLDGKGVRSHSHAPAKVILEKCVACHTPYTMYGVSHMLKIHSISILLITLLTVALIEH